MEQRKIFAGRLKRLREDNGYTLEQLAKVLRDKYNIGATYGSLGNYERATRIPNFFILSKLSEFFDVSSDFLIGLTDVKNARVIQTTIFDKDDKPHTVKIGINKDSDLTEMSVKDVTDLILRLKKLGFDFDKVN